MSLRPPSSASLLEQSLLGLTALAVVAMLSLPAARSVSESFGWLPFWLLALPLSAWITARILRYRSDSQRQRAYALPMATVHPIALARTQAKHPQALRRAA
jgi:ABC-type phosphate transport system permease subunit